MPEKSRIILGRGAIAPGAAEGFEEGVVVGVGGEDDIAVVAAEGQAIVIGSEWTSHPRQGDRSEGGMQGKTELTLGFSPSGSLTPSARVCPSIILQIYMNFFTMNQLVKIISVFNNHF
jgi:hypothetical protein